jgi:hypothetical protein
MGPRPVAGISHPQSPIHTRIAAAQSTDWNKVDAALGEAATVSGEVHRYGLPRSNLQVALGGWVAFAPVHGQAMLMGPSRNRDHPGHDEARKQRD